MDLAYQEFLEEVLWRAKKEGAEYADCRLFPKVASEHLKVENGHITTLNSSLSQGFGVRVLKNGSWGFYASPIIRKNKIDKVVARAIHSAEANARIQKEKVILAPLPEAWPHNKVVTYKTDFEIDPFSIPIEQKIILLASVDEAIKQASDKVFWRIGEISSLIRQKLFASTDGVLLDQTFVETGATAQAHARGGPNNDTQQRSFPNSHVNYNQGGYELVQKVDLVRGAAQAAKEAEQLLEAPKAPSGKRGIILLPEMLNLHIHETTHGFEADRVLGTEWTLAGGSFLTELLPQIGNFQFGSEKVNLTADSITEHGIATFAYDDEGTPAQSNPLVKNGVWTGLLTSRQTVPQLNEAIGKKYFERASGAMRATDYSYWPVIRMVNILLEPGEKDLDTLKEEVPDGTIMFGTNRSWSIDDVRRHFTFGTEIAWEKVKGKWEMRKDAKYHGDNLHFWRNCKTVCGKKDFKLEGIGNCGKADPLQTIPTGHGSSPAYFTDIQVDSVT